MKRILIENSITVKELNEGLKKVEGMQLISVDAGNDASDKGLFLDFKPVPIPKSGLTGFKEWLKEENEFNAGARIAEEMIKDFEKEQEKPRYYVDFDKVVDSWDVRLKEHEDPCDDDSVAIFYLKDIPDAEKRAHDLCEELNQKEKMGPPCVDTRLEQDMNGILYSKNKY